MASILTLKGLTFPIKLVEKKTGIMENVLDEEGNIIDTYEKTVVTPEIEGYNNVLSSSLNNITIFPVTRRYNNPMFGTALPTIMKEPNDEVLQALIRTLVINRIIDQEPRVKITHAIFTRRAEVGMGLDLSFEVPLEIDL